MKDKPAAARHGLLAGGNWIIDHVKMVDTYPPPEQLANIRTQHQGTGGAPYNVLLDLAKAGAKFPLFGAGLVGKDALGEQILADCARHKIDTRLLQTTNKAATSYTDVMTEEKTGRRTFFHYRGANALWKGEGLDFARTRARMFHLGYLLLLDALDEMDPRFGTRAARLLAAAQEAGLKTSVDVVSEATGRHRSVVPHALKFVDYLIVNDFEASQITGFRTRDAEGKLDTVALRHAAGALLQMGVRELVAVHFPEGGFARTRKGEDVWQPSVKVPEKAIAGTAGAGDAFATGVLWGMHEDWELQRGLQAAVCLAAACLLDPTTTAGIKPLNTCLALGKKYGYRPPLEQVDL